jgi:pheromone shutdown protein TraB
LVISGKTKKHFQLSVSACAESKSEIGIENGKVQSVYIAGIVGIMWPVIMVVMMNALLIVAVMWPVIMVVVVNVLLIMMAEMFFISMVVGVAAAAMASIASAVAAGPCAGGKKKHNDGCTYGQFKCHRFHSYPFSI